MTAIFVFETAMLQIFALDYPKLISEYWCFTAKYHCLQAIYFDAPSALTVPMCGVSEVGCVDNVLHYAFNHVSASSKYC